MHRVRRGSERERAHLDASWRCTHNAGGLVNVRLNAGRLVELGENVGERVQLLDVRSEARRRWKVGRQRGLVGEG